MSWRRRTLKDRLQRTQLLVLFHFASSRATQNAPTTTRNFLTRPINSQMSLLPLIILYRITLKYLYSFADIKRPHDRDQLTLSFDGKALRKFPRWPSSKESLSAIFTLRISSFSAFVSATYLCIRLLNCSARSFLVLKTNRPCLNLLVSSLNRQVEQSKGVPNQVKLDLLIQWTVCSKWREVVDFDQARLQFTVNHNI